MHDDVPAYGLWSLVIINSAIFIFFAFTFFKPQTKRDWRSFSIRLRFSRLLSDRAWPRPTRSMLIRSRKECAAKYAL